MDVFGKNRKCWRQKQIKQEVLLENTLQKYLVVMVLRVDDSQYFLYGYY